MNVTPIVTVTLSRPWGPHAAGSVVEVDAIKAGTLDELGYIQHAQEPKPKRKEKRG